MSHDVSTETADTGDAAAPADHGRNMTNPGGKQRFRNPTIQCARVDRDVPPDVIEEWGGQTQSPSRSLEGPDETGDQATPRRERPSDTPWLGGASGGATTNFPIRRRDGREFELDGELLLFDSNAGILYALNETAFAIWRGCQGKTACDVASMLCDRYEVDAETAVEHVHEVLDRLELGGLISYEGVDVAIA